MNLKNSKRSLNVRRISHCNDGTSCDNFLIMVLTMLLMVLVQESQSILLFESHKFSSTLLQAKAVVAAIEAATESIFKALSSQTALGEDPVAIKTPAMALTAVKKLPSEVGSSPMSVGEGSFGMPKASGDDNNTEPVDMKVCQN